MQTSLRVSIAQQDEDLTRYDLVAFENARRRLVRRLMLAGSITHDRYRYELDTDGLTIVVQRIDDEEVDASKRLLLGGSD